MGIAVHHAGLSMDDRKAVEELYLQKTLRVLVATSVRLTSDSIQIGLIVHRLWPLELIYVSCSLD